MRVFAGLGSNLLNPLQQVQTALQVLQQHPAITAFKHSPFYHSKPLGPIKQPDFINAVALFETTLTAHECLNLFLHIENQQGRKRGPIPWGPRTLDIDLLLYGDKTINTPDLTVPHPEMCKRNFVLYPLAELAPDLILPDGKSLQDLLKTCPSDGLQALKLMTSDSH